MNSIKWLVLTGLIVSLLTGCSTTSGQLIATSFVTVDHAMKAWAVYVEDGHATQEQEREVRKLKLKYDRAEDLALEAYSKFSATKDRTEWEIAKELLLTEQTALINFIEQLTGKDL